MPRSTLQAMSTSSTATYLLEASYPVEFTPGARSAVTTCLRIDPSEKVTLITDHTTEPIAAALAAQLEELGCQWNAFVLEELAPRPLGNMPQAVLDDMESSQVSIFAVQVQQNELQSRMQMTDVVNRRHMRHAHMVNITPEIMCSGMRADFNRVDRLSQQVLDRVRKATRIRATTAAGTDITAEMNPGYKWFKTSGIISPEKWGNLPGGECFTSPGEVNGTFVVDGVVGDWLCARYGLLHSTPLTIEIAANRIVSCRSENKALEADFWAYTHGRELRPCRRVRHRHQSRRRPRYRQYSAGREVPRHPHRLREPVWRAHRRPVALGHTYRRGRPRLQYLARVRRRPGTDHAGRSLPHRRVTLPRGSDQRTM